MIIQELSFELPKTDTVPEWIQVLPKGNFEGRDGRTFNNSNPDLIIAKFKENESPLPVDYEHATEGELGTLAPAMGWITSLENRNGELWAKIEWTPRGAELVKNREYRFVSPSFFYDTESEEITSLSSVALTNKPNLKMKALNTQQPISNIEEKVMPLYENPQELPALVKKIIEVLELSEDATAEDVINAITSLKEEMMKESEQQNEELASEKVELQKYKANYAQLQAVAKQTEQRALNAEKKVDFLQEEMNNSKIQAFIDKEGVNRVSPAMRDGVERLAKYLCKDLGMVKGLEALSSHIQSIPEFDTPVKFDMKRIQESADDFKKMADLIAKGANR